MQLSAYLPEFLTQSRIICAVLNAEQAEIDRINGDAQDLLNQCFVDTATWGLSLWESFVGIATDISKNLEYRRSCVLSKLRGIGPVTPEMLQNLANSFENGDVEVIEHPADYTVEIKFVGTIGVPPNIADLQGSIAQVIPAHLAVEYTYLYAQWQNAQSKTWGTVQSSTWSAIMNGGS